MRSRGLVVAIAVVLAVAAAAAVILYTQGVKEEAQGRGDQRTVIVSTREIVSNEPLDPLLAQGIFKQIRVPDDALVSGAVTDVGELSGATTTATIYANEQIPTSRLSTADVAPNRYGISSGHIGVAFEFEAPQGGAGNIQPGDHVSVFATYQNVRATTGGGERQELPDFTVTLIPSVKVLRIENPAVDAETGQQNVSDAIRVTLDLEPQDAQNLVFAKESALVWLGLLPPNEDGTQPRASTVPVELLRGAQLG